MRVAFERCIQQVSDGTHYNGYIKISDTTFDFDLVFAHSIPEIEKNRLAENVGWEDLRHIYQLTLKRDGVELELADKEYVFFFNALVVPTVDFYNDPETRASNSENAPVGMTARGQGLLAKIGGSASIAVKIKADCDLTIPACVMLSSAKFGCNIFN